MGDYNTTSATPAINTVVSQHRNTTKQRFSLKRCVSRDLEGALHNHQGGIRRINNSRTKELLKIKLKWLIQTSYSEHEDKLCRTSCLCSCLMLKDGQFQSNHCGDETIPYGNAGAARYHSNSSICCLCYLFLTRHILSPHSSILLPKRNLTTASGSFQVRQRL